MRLNTKGVCKPLYKVFLAFLGLGDVKFNVGDEHAVKTFVLFIRLRVVGRFGASPHL